MYCLYGGRTIFVWMPFSTQIVGDQQSPLITANQVQHRKPIETGAESDFYPLALFAMPVQSQVNRCPLSSS